MGAIFIERYRPEYGQYLYFHTLVLTCSYVCIGLVYRARPSSRSRNFRMRIIKRGWEAGEIIIDTP